MAPKGRKSPPPAAVSSSSNNDSDENSSSSEEREVKVQNDLKPAAKLDTESDSDSGSDSPPPLKPGKRPASESDKTPEKKKKKAKTDKAESSGGLTQNESGSNRKVLFQRLWSEEDELVILKGMVDYKVKKLRDAVRFPDDFLQFIKKSLQFVDANKGQIVSKIRGLKKKYDNAKKKKITNPNQLKAFQLSKQVWGGGDDEVRVEENNGAVESHNGSASNPKSKANNNKGVINGQALEGGMANRVISSCEREMPISVIGDGNKLIGFFNERVLKEGMKLLGEGGRAEMADKLRKHNVAEMEVYLKRMDLIKKTLNAIESARK